VAGCIQLADKAICALRPRLGRGVKLDAQAVKASAGQTSVSPNGVLQENGVAVFGYAVTFDVPEMPPHVVNFFLSVGMVPGGKGKPDDWYVGHDEESFSMAHGGEGEELEPLFAHVVGALEAQLAAAYPTDAAHGPEKEEKPEASKTKASE
jgi:hypothetical protein